jgi:hypothetical protein
MNKRSKRECLGTDRVMTVNTIACSARLSLSVSLLEVPDKDGRAEFDMDP